MACQSVNLKVRVVAPRANLRNCSGVPERGGRPELRPQSTRHLGRRKSVCPSICSPSWMLNFLLGRRVPRQTKNMYR